MAQSRVDRQQTYHCKTGGGAPGYPLTMATALSRFLLACQGLPGTNGKGVRRVREWVFRRCGQPEVFRPDIFFPHAQLAPDVAVELSRGTLRISRCALSMEGVATAVLDRAALDGRKAQDDGADPRVLDAGAGQPAAAIGSRSGLAPCGRRPTERQKKSTLTSGRWREVGAPMLQEHGLLGIEASGEPGSGPPT